MHADSGGAEARALDRHGGTGDGRAAHSMGGGQTTWTGMEGQRTKQMYVMKNMTLKRVAGICKAQAVTAPTGQFRWWQQMHGAGAGSVRADM